MTYRPVRRIGRGGTAEVWLARDPAGREVALKRVPPAGVAAARAAAALGHPNVLPLLDATGEMLVLPYLPGGSLAAALAAGARYAPPQAAALAAAVAGALAATHAAGLVHGDVKPANVLLADAGTPLLADFAGRGTPEDDVRRLVALALALDPGLAPVLDGVTTAAEARDRLAAYAPPVDGDDPEPTRDFGPRPPPSDPPAPPFSEDHHARGGRPGLQRTRLAALAAAAVLLLAVVVGWSLPRASSAGALPPASPVPATNWPATLAALDAARSAAFARADSAALADVYLPGSAVLAADRALLARYAARRTRVANLHLVADAVTPATPARGDVGVLDVTDRLLPYTVVDASGRTVARYPGRGAARWRITLRHTGRGWRVAEVTRVPEIPP
jgi:hypothetical protein